MSASPERRIFVGGELAQTIAAATEPWRTLFRLASVVGARESELLGLWWQDLDLSDLNAETIRFGFQADRDGKRVELKTVASKATLPLPRSTTLMLLEHKARTRGADVPAIVRIREADGRAPDQRNVLRALYRAQERARDADGRPTFPELFEHDERGHLVVDEDGEYVRRDVKRRELRLADFHALRHGAAMDCDDAEEGPRRAAAQEQERHARWLPGALRRSRARAAARAHGTTGDVEPRCGRGHGTGRRGIEGAA